MLLATEKSKENLGCIFVSCKLKGFEYFKFNSILLMSEVARRKDFNGDLEC